MSEGFECMGCWEINDNIFTHVCKKVNLRTYIESTLNTLKDELIESGVSEKRYKQLMTRYFNINIKEYEDSSEEKIKKINEIMKIVD